MRILNIVLIIICTLASLPLIAEHEPTDKNDAAGGSRPVVQASEDSKKQEYKKRFSAMLESLATAERWKFKDCLHGNGDGGSNPIEMTVKLRYVAKRSSQRKLLFVANRARFLYPTVFENNSPSKRDGRAVLWRGDGTQYKRVAAVPLEIFYEEGTSGFKSITTISAPKDAQRQESKPGVIYVLRKVDNKGNAVTVRVLLEKTTAGKVKRSYMLINYCGQGYGFREFGEGFRDNDGAKDNPASKTGPHAMRASLLLLPKYLEKF